MEAKPKQLSELTEEVQQPLQLTADVDSFGDELSTSAVSCNGCWTSSVSSDNCFGFASIFVDSTVLGI